MEITVRSFHEFPSSVTVGDTVVVREVGFYTCTGGVPAAKKVRTDGYYYTPRTGGFMDPWWSGIGYYVPRNLTLGSLPASSERRWFAWLEATRASPCDFTGMHGTKYFYGPAIIQITQAMWDLQNMGATMFIYVAPYEKGRYIIGSRSSEVKNFTVIQCVEGTKRSPLTCWDGSTIDTEICSGGIWIPTGEVCPVMPAHGEKRTPTTCWDGSVIHAEKFDAVTKTWVPTGEVCPLVPPHGEKRNPTTCWDGSIIHAEVFDGSLKRWIPTGESCPTEPAAGEKRNPTTCWDGSIIHAEKYDTILHRWIPSGEVCPTEPAAGEKRNPTTCWDGTVIYGEVFREGMWVSTGAKCPTEPGAGEKRNPTTCWDGTVIYGEVFREGRWVSTGAKCPTEPAAGAKRNPTTCRDGSVIYGEVFVDGAWIPSGEKCPEEIARRTMMAAVPKIMYAGQAVDIVVGAYIGAAPSTDETAILTIDGTEISRMNTKAGEVKFRWTAEGVGMHNLCVTIPANVNLPTPGSICKTIMVSADIGGIKERVKSEMEAYKDELKMIRKKKQLAREELKRYVPPGRIGVPASLAGSSIEIGGIVRTVPPEGMTIPISAGDHQIVVIVEGIRKMIPVIVLPGEEVMLP